MQTSELAKGIAAKFEHSRLVFWYDAEQRFTDEATQFAVEGITGLDVCVLNMSELSVLQTKKRIELDEPLQAFLLYFPHAEPEPDNDWLLDVRLYSEQFFADHSSMLLTELGIPLMALRSHIHGRQAFLNDKQRRLHLKKWVTEAENEQSLDCKMIAVVAKADSASLKDILQSLLKDYADSLGQGADTPPALEQLSKFGLTDALWTELGQEFGYRAEKPSINDFVLKLFCTEFWSHLENANRDWLRNNVLASASCRSTALAFMSSWRDSRQFSASYEQIAKMLEQELEIGRHSLAYQPLELLECETFEAIEQSMIRGLVLELLDTSQQLDKVLFERMLSRRMASHWVMSRAEYRAIYEALRAAEVLLHLRQRYVDGFHYQSAAAMYQAYTEELYQFDQAYRNFNEHVHSVQSKGADILRQLDDEVESLYTTWYLYELSLAWDGLLAKDLCATNTSGDDSQLTTWQLPGVPAQQSFYQREVQSLFNTTQIKRVFVVISDALRYEVAHELSTSINNERRFKADLSTQLGVLPSYTQLGMAALLPHQELSYRAASDQSAIVYADGQSTSGIENRHAILQKVNGLAVTARELMRWTNQEGREKVKDAAVVYIYHDTIDAIGDKGATEDKTFEACRAAINELKDLVGRVINRLNGSRVLITADHGFLFQQQALAAADKTVLQHKAEGAIEAKKRYIIGEQLTAGHVCWKGEIKVSTAKSRNTELSSHLPNTEFILPKGVQRFHFVGGAKFVHGGAMPQEVCVPVLQVRELQKEQVAKHEKQPVGVVVATQPIKLVNSIDKIRFIQTDPVSERTVARQLDVFIVDPAGNTVSSRETLNFDSISKAMDDRVRVARLKLIGAQFDRNAAYTLVLENTATRTRYNQYAVTIDLAFQDDFF
ncbi:BREX-1 system phosphatase PglZ type A [Oceanisphaera sp. IT1-181]|uniref:BREX-1 system phosphatase PglZ type A n=1 Tax=Oceanisphaera sp. IT1-181 TaxID=3081199 RepID=UPI0029CA1656|nr:BREX-1 system phosphatase PglZ type A [Oceanisphaera sp. IT1-181]